MEQEFLQALQPFYYEGKAIMSNEEFDNLKDELMWEGSSVVMLSSDEQRFLEASIAYVPGKPILSGEEFDKLKLKLKNDGSNIVIEGPRCSLRSRKVYSDLYLDYQKMFLLNVPGAVVSLGLFFFVDDLTGFEINLFKFPEPFGFLFTWFAAIPFLLWGSVSLTRSVVKDFSILKGPFPNCGTENISFFGTILSVSSGGSTNSVKCSKMDPDSADSPIPPSKPSRPEPATSTVPEKVSFSSDSSAISSWAKGLKLTQPLAPANDNSSNENAVKSAFSRLTSGFGVSSPSKSPGSDGSTVGNPSAPQSSVFESFTKGVVDTSMGGFSSW